MRRLFAFHRKHQVLVLATACMVNMPSLWAQTPSATTPAIQSPGADSATLQAEHSFARADMDGDGFLTREEAQKLPAVFEKFDQWDHDGDGKISRQEFLNAASAQPVNK